MVRVQWSEFIANFDWRQGEHVTLIAPTGEGKTTVAKELLKLREQRNGFITCIATKPRDPIWKELVKERDYKITKKWPPPRGTKRAIVWPPLKNREHVVKQRQVIDKAFADMFGRGGYAIYVDELPWLIDGLRLGSWVKTIWMQGRSLKLTLISGVQRPRNVPVEAYSSSTHLFIWRTNDEEDLKRVSGLGGMSNRAIREHIGGLQQYEFLHINTRDRELNISKVEL